MAERALHIGIDGRELGPHPRGVGRYLQQILRVWLEDPRQRHRFTIFAAAEPPTGFPSVPEPATWRVAPAAFAGTWWEQTALPAMARREAVDVLFAPAYTAPVRIDCPVVLTIHDLSYFAHPEWFMWREGMRRRWITRLAARRAAAIVTVSEFSAGEIVSRLSIDRGRVHVVPHGAPTVTAPADPPARAPLVLYVGSMFNRRRIPDLLRAFAITAKTVPNARLVLIGDNQMRPAVDPLALAAGLGVGDRVEWRAWAPDAELEHLYWTAGVFAFLSDYEGFALTPLEALAHDVPAVLLDTPVAREIYRDAAAYVPAAPPAIADALTGLLTDSGRRSAAIARGRQVLSAYSWTRAAADVLRVLEQAASR